MPNRPPLVAKKQYKNGSQIRLNADHGFGKAAAHLQVTSLRLNFLPRTSDRRPQHVKYSNFAGFAPQLNKYGGGLKETGFSTLTPSGRPSSHPLAPKILSNEGPQSRQIAGLPSHPLLMDFNTSCAGYPEERHTSTSGMSRNARVFLVWHCN